MAICWPSVLILATWISVMNFTIEATTEKIVSCRMRWKWWAGPIRGLLSNAIWAAAWKQCLELQRSLYSQAQSRTSWLHRFCKCRCIQRIYSKHLCFHPMYKKLALAHRWLSLQRKEFLVFSPNVFMLVSSFNNKSGRSLFPIGLRKNWHAQKLCYRWFWWVFTSKDNWLTKKFQ